MDLPWLGKKMKGIEPLTKKQELALRNRAKDDEDILSLLDELSYLRSKEKKHKPGSKTESDRKLAELEALVAGLTTEVSRVYEKLDGCESKLGEVMFFIRKIQNKERTITPPGL